MWRRIGRSGAAPAGPMRREDGVDPVLAALEEVHLGLGQVAEAPMEHDRQGDVVQGGAVGRRMAGAHPAGVFAVGGGVTWATGRPKRVTRTGLPVCSTRARTARQVALNSDILIRSMRKIAPWSTIMVQIESSACSYPI